MRIVKNDYEQLQFIMYSTENNFNSFQHRYSYSKYPHDLFYNQRENFQVGIK